ncbi:MAG: M24 family metallopeptidase, partial [SAR324 cluster bacterium]|nr:M24 family metallopeptidase [SAR324 cluster bacterium]
KGEYKRMWELWKELREMIPKELRPGRNLTDVGAKFEDMVNEWGFECDYLGHAIGVAYSEVPYISSGPRHARYMEWTILPNEVYVVHPMIRAKGKKPPLAWVADMYLVGEDSTKWMTPFLPGLPEMIPR